MFRNMYQGRRVFVTGHTGFKGSWICAWLTSLGAEVMGYSCDIPTQPSHIEAMHLGEHIRQVQGDIRDRDALIRAMKEFKPDVVFHLAAQALVRKSYDEPVLTFESNVMGTMNVLEAVRACPSVGAVVMITSDKCYRNDEQVWGYRETDHLGGYDPYSASKGCAEIVAHSYFRSFFRNGPACATVRAGNVIGGGDWAVQQHVLRGRSRVRRNHHWYCGDSKALRCEVHPPVRPAQADPPPAHSVRPALRSAPRALR